MKASSKAGAALLLGLAGGALALGAWVSFHDCFSLWRPDPDIFVTVELWRGVQRYGPKFLASWAYTQDNWLLSLIPLSSLAFAALGPSAAVAIGIGWAFFLASVAMTGWLAAKLAGWRAGLVLSVVLIFANDQALGRAGYLGYPISHNVSMAWALLALILALRGLEQGSLAACIAAGVVVFLDAVSDPWAGVGLACPLIFAAGALAWAHRGQGPGRSAAVLALASTVGLVAARTRLFGVFDFLPKSHFEFATGQEMLRNLYWGSKSLAAIFDILPGPAGSGAAGLLSLAAIFLLVAWAFGMGAHGLRTASAGRQLIFGVSLLSIGAVAVLFIVGRWDGALTAGRFFPNLYFLGGLLVAVTAADQWSRSRRAPKLVVGVYAGLLVLTGLASQPSVWTGRAAPPPRSEALDLADFLQAHALSYGYGVFWGAHALVTDTLTEGRVIIRPVSFRDGDVRRRPAETSSLWYTTADGPPSPRPFVVIRADGEECPSVDACAAIARRQFGAPAEQLVWRDATILVWPRSIAAEIRP